MNVRATTSLTTRSTSSVERAMSRSREKTSSTTRTTTKRKNTSAYPPRAKRQRAANSHHDSDSEDETEREVDASPLTKADIPEDIPTIMDAFPNNISTEGTSSKEDSQDISHLGEYRLAIVFLRVLLVIILTSDKLLRT